MPKTPAGISKSLRRDTVEFILVQWGRLNKTQIDSHVAKELKVSSDEISRSIYRDLEELVHLGRIQVHYYTRDGREIEEFNPQIHKNVTCQWSAQSSGARFLGAEYLTQTRTEYLISSRLEKIVSAEPLNHPVDEASSSCYLMFNSTGFCLKTLHSDLPVTWIIGRKSDNTSSGELLTQLEAKFGHRLIVLMLPLPTMSSVNGQSKWGHFKLTIKESDRAELEDLGSKNGTSFISLKMNEAKSLHRFHSGNESSTVPTQTAHQGPFGLESSTPCGSQSEKIELPACVYATPFFKMLVF